MDRLQPLTVDQVIKMAGISKENRLGDDIIVFDSTIDLVPYKHLLSHPCRLEAISVVICISGSMKATIDLKEYTLTEGTLLANLPQNIVQIDSLDEFRAIGIIVSTPYMKSLGADIAMLMPLFHYFQTQCTLRLSHEQVALLTRYAELLGTSILSKRSPYKNEIVANIISLLCYNVSDFIKSREQRATSSVTGKQAILYEQFMRLLVENHRSQRSVIFYAERLDLSPKYLSKIIHEFSGKSAAVWIDEYVIIEAKTLLRYSRMTIQEITLHLSFSTQSFFGRYFKHHTGISPGEYRKRG